MARPVGPITPPANGGDAPKRASSCAAPAVMEARTRTRVTRKATRIATEEIAGRGRVAGRDTGPVRPVRAFREARPTRARRQIAVA